VSAKVALELQQFEAEFKTGLLPSLANTADVVVRGAEVGCRATPPTV
jgi:hypothetical protein